MAEIAEYDFAIPGTDSFTETASIDDVEQSSEFMKDNLDRLLPDDVKDQLKKNDTTVIVDAGAGKTMMGSIATSKFLNPEATAHIKAIDVEIYDKKLRTYGKEIINKRNPKAEIEEHYGQTFQGYVREHPNQQADVVMFANSEFAFGVPEQSVVEATKTGGIVIEYQPVRNLPDLTKDGFQLLTERQGKQGMGNSKVWRKL